MNWKEIKLQEICTFRTGKLNSNAAVENGIYPFFTCSPEVLRINSYSFDTEAVLLAGNNADGKFNVKIYNGKFDAYQRTYIINSNKKNIINIKYLFYILGLQLNFLKEISMGTATKFLTLNILNNIKIPLPPLPEQRAIAEILSSIDDKIELNNQMNRTLEETAQAIFKQWFVDFKFPETISDISHISTGFKPRANMANDGVKMIDSELGPIPEGWRVENIQNVLELAYGKSLKADTRIDGNIPVYGSNGIVGYHNEPLVKGPGIVIGRKGNPGTVIWVDIDFFPIDTTFYVDVKNKECNLYYLYYELKRQKLNELSADSAVPGLSRNIFYMNKIIIPDKIVLEAFEKLIKPIFENIYHNNKQSQTLSTLRDTLLPKLMSGELRVPEEIVKKYEEYAEAQPHEINLKVAEDNA